MKIKTECGCGCGQEVEIDLSSENEMDNTKENKMSPVMVGDNEVRTNLRELSKTELISRIENLETRLAAVNKRSNNRKRSLRSLTKAHMTSVYAVRVLTEELNRARDLVRKGLTPVKPSFWNRWF